MFPIPLLRSYVPDEDLLKKSEYCPESLFQLNEDIGKTHPEVWLDYLALGLWIFCWGFSFWILLFW